MAKAALSTINQPAFLAHVRDTGVHLRERLLSVQQQCPLIVADVRGRGLIQGIELRVDPGTSGFIDMARERGLLLVSAGKNTVRMVPPLIVTREQIDEAVEVVREVLVELERGIQFE